MDIQYEFLNEEPIENVITCLNYRFDKVVFFGYERERKRWKKTLTDFLASHCEMARENIVFIDMPEYHLDKIYALLEEEVGKALKNGDGVYFDATGGESLILVAFGMLAAKKKLPMHTFDVRSGKLIELNPSQAVSIRERMAHKRWKRGLNLNDYIALHGGVIVPHRTGKDGESDDLRTGEDTQMLAAIPRIWNVYRREQRFWPAYTFFLQCIGYGKAQLGRVIKEQEIRDVLARTKKQYIKTPFTEAVLRRMMSALKQAGVFQNYSWKDGLFKYRFVSEKMIKLTHMTGMLLELHVKEVEKGKNDHCHVSVHIDWDGDVHTDPHKDVANEIDVMTLKGYVPTFISCKIGSVNKMALYELATVADRFGGKYAKKKLVAPMGVGETDRLRAAEMGIEIVYDV